MKNNIPDDVAHTFFYENVESATKTSGGYVGRCPACGDSQKSSQKKRLYLLYKPDRGWGVYCHNCELSQSLYYFVQDYFPSYFSYFKSRCFKEYIYEKKQSSEEILEDKLKKALLKKRKNKVIKSYEKPKEKTEVEEFYENCLPLSDDQKSEISKRNLPTHIVDSLRFCKYVKDKRHMNMKDRIIIPFFDDKGSVFFFQGRSTLDEQTPKYLNWDGLDSKPEFNEHHVDKTKRVYIVEGLFDSTFVDNSVSTLGAKFSYEKLLYFKEKYPNGVYCLDNDDTGLYWTKKLLKDNYTCLVFPPEYRELKDLNDIVIKTGINNLTKFVEDNIYKGVVGLLKVQQLLRS